VLPQPRVGGVHVRHDDRDVLEPAVVAARVRRHRPAARGQELGELDLLAAKPPASSTSDSFSNVSTSVKKATERSMSDTVMPTTATSCTRGAVASAAAACGRGAGTTARSSATTTAA